MSMFKMENTEGFPGTKYKVETYTEDAIQAAIKNYVLSWDYDTLVDYAMQGMYKKYMDRKQSRIHIDTLMAEFGDKQ